MIVLNDHPLTASENMAKDLFLLSQLYNTSSPLLRFYAWKHPSATYGHFIDPWKLLNQEKVLAASLDLAKRPTGGGVIFHAFDLTYSFFLPSTSPAFSKKTKHNLEWIHGIVASAIEKTIGEKCSLVPSHCGEGTRPTFCMAEPVCFDILVDGKKVAGGAQRRTKQGFLHQGSISLFPPDWILVENVLKLPEMHLSMKEKAGSLFLHEDPKKREVLSHCLIKGFKTSLSTLSEADLFEH